MKRNIRILANLVLWGFCFCPQLNVLFAQDRAGARACQVFRDSLNRVFSTPGSTILDSARLATFDGIPFFAYDSSYCVSAKVKRIRNGKVQVMLTSGERRPVYVQVAKVRFVLHGKRQKLTLYSFQNPPKPEYANHVMLAFADGTNGFETYGGGRYLDFDIKDLKKWMTIDFNFAYNPYCAYMDGYACVIPPAENRMDVGIQAGARVLNHH